MNKESSISLLLRNRFEVLNDIKDDDAQRTSQSEQPKTSSKEKIPPITLSKNQYNEVCKLMSNLKVKDYSVKFMSIGLRIQLSAMADYKRVCEAFIESNVKFFTHESRENMPLKVVLKGLYSMETTELSTILSEVNVVCEDIKVLKFKRQSFNDQSHYLLYVKKGTTNINELRKIRAVNNVCVTWEYFRRPSGPTQCRNCQLYGHGTKHCHLNPKCVKCGGGHATAACKVNVEENNKKNLKCANCGGNHSANYSKCEVLAKYLRIRQNNSNQTAKSASRVKRDAVVTSSSTHKPNFPPLASRHSTAQKVWFSQFKPQNCSQNATDDHSYSHRHTDGRDDLFNTQELLGITKELINNLRQCKSKYDQIEVITELALKYLPHGQSN